MGDQAPQAGAVQEASAKASSAADAGTAKEPVATDMETNDTGAGRLFLPTDREDALLLLGGLCISAHLPDSSTRLAVKDGTPALVERGLRSSEEELLRGEQKERFPVLIEFAPGTAGPLPQVLGLDQVVRLVFRSQEDADAFRFRPVDEFDPESIDYRVEPACFGLEGEARFVFRHGAHEGNPRLGHQVDRLAAALHYVLMLGEARADCRNAVHDFLAAPTDDKSGEPTLASVCQVLVGGVESTTAARQLRAVVHGFADAESLPPGALVDEIACSLMAMEPSEGRVRDAEAKWIAIARDVARNRLALDGSLLSDDRSVLLRGALLALVPDSIEAVIAFLQAEKPAGIRVATFATFLIGLKQGVLGTSWSVKGRHARQLAGICRLLIEAAGRSAGALDGVISTSVVEGADSLTRQVFAGSMKLADWTSPKVRPPDPVEEEWIADFERLGYQVQAPGRTERSWMVALSSGLLVEVRHCATAGHRFPMLRHRLDRGEKLRKLKEISAAFSPGGHLWSPRTDEDGMLCLCCELHSLPARSETGAIVATLEAAVGLCVAPAKAARKRGTKSSKVGPQP